MIFSSPRPIIDVWDKLMIASDGILHGKNPYLLTYTKLYKGINPSPFGHLPGLFIVFAPVLHLFKDVRFVYVFSDILIIYLFTKLFKKRSKFVFQNLSLVYLFNPVALFVFEQSWLEPFMLASLFLFYYLSKRRKFGLSVLPLAIFLTTKTIDCLSLPVILKLKKIKKKYIFISLFLAFLVVLPFFIWSPVVLMDTILLRIFKNNYDSSAPTHIALTFRNMLKDIFGIYYRKKTAFFVSFIFPLISYLFVKIGSFYKVFLTLSFMYLGFYFFNYQAFCNYFFFVSGLVLFALIDFFLSPNKNS